MDPITYTIGEGKYSVRIASTLHAHFAKKFWDIFETMFSPGSGANKDFAFYYEFKELLEDDETLVAYVMDKEGALEEEIAVFAIFTRSEEVILKYAKRDFVFLINQAKEKANAKCVFWVFLFCPNGARRYVGPHTKAMFAAMATYAHGRRGVIMFDEDPEKGLSRRIGEYLKETAGIISTPQAIQTLQTTMLSFEFPRIAKGQKK